MNIVALQTVRAGSKSVPNKNLYMYDYAPMFMHNIIQASICKFIKDTYISTDIEDILNYRHGYERLYKTIKRPTKLCQDNSSHLETILHGLFEIEQDRQEKVDILVVLLGNTPHAHEADLSNAIERFVQDFDKYDSCMSVGKFSMFNPFRAFHMLEDGSLTSVINPKIADFLAKNKNQNDKNCFGDIYFFNGSFWILKRETLIEHNGDNVFPWIGNRIMPYGQPSVYQEIDAEWQLKLLG